MSNTSKILATIAIALGLLIVGIQIAERKFANAGQVPSGRLEITPDMGGPQLQLQEKTPEIREDTQTPQIRPDEDAQVNPNNKKRLPIMPRRNQPQYQQPRQYQGGQQYGGGCAPSQPYGGGCQPQGCQPPQGYGQPYGGGCQPQGCQPQGYGYGSCQ